MRDERAGADCGRGRALRWFAKWIAVLGFVAAGAVSVGVSPAAANGPCGQDFDGNHACGVSSPVNDNGSLATDNESDYYVFYAQKGTELQVTATDSENPGCSADGSTTSCGSVYAELYDSQGNDLYEGTGDSYPNNAITVPRTLSTTLTSAGTYYVVVKGSLGFDAHDNPIAVPYTLNFSASPNVAWPQPTSNPPPTTTPSNGWQGALNLGGSPLGSRPTAGVDVAGEQFVFWQGTDGTLWDKWYTGHSWHGPAKIATAGRMASAPSVAVGRGGEQDVFWKGTDGNLWETWHTQGWHRAVNLHAGPLGSAPAAGVDGRGELFVFWEGTDGSLWDRWYTSGRWHGPGRITVAGKMGSPPAVAVKRSGEQDVFWRGRDGNLWETWHTQSWHPPVDLGAGPLGSAPTAGVDQAGEQFVFWQGTDSTLWDRWYTGGQWHGPAKITTAGTLGSAPGVAVQPSGQQNVFWKGTDGNLWETWHP